MNEDFLIYLWQFQLIAPRFYTVNGEPVQVIHPGKRNTHSGPDFFNSRIRIGQTTWAGNVEVHVKATDWDAHGHQHDAAFDNIILHVVYQADQAVLRKNKEIIPTIELKDKFDENIFLRYRSFIELNKWIPCEELIDTVPYFKLVSYLDKLMIERLETRSGNINNELDLIKQDFNEVFYRKLLKNFGFKVNDTPFELLAKALPLKILAKHSNHPEQVEALLFGQAGMLNRTFKENYPKALKAEYQFLAGKYNLVPISPKLWRFMRLRPANFPTIRIAQFARLIVSTSAQITGILEADKLGDVVKLFAVETHPYWETHYRFDVGVPPRKKRIGKSSVDLLLINTIIPFLFVYGQYKNDMQLQDKALNWMEQIKAENNTIIRKFKSLKIAPRNAMQSQALLQLKIIYCDEKRCLECSIGHHLLNKQ